MGQAAPGAHALGPGAFEICFYAGRRRPRAHALNGSPVTADMLKADIDAGAPTNADGSINLVHYAAWGGSGY